MLEKRDTWTAAAGALALAVLYFSLRTQDHSYDAAAYALTADIPSAGDFFHDYHLLYTPMVWLVLTPLRALGYAGSSYGPGAFLSAVLAAAAVGYKKAALKGGYITWQYYV